MTGLIAAVMLFGAAGFNPPPIPPDENLYSWYISARLAMEEGNHSRAAAILREALRVWPEASMLHASLAQAALELGDVATAQAEARRALEIDPDLVEAHRVLVSVLLAQPTQENLPMAERHLARVVELDPRDGASRLRLGIIRGHMGDFAGGIQALQGFRAGANGYARARYEIGNFYLRMGQIDAAETAYRDAAHPHSGGAEPDVRREALRRLGEIREGRGDLAGAREAYRDLSRELPNDPDALKRLLRVLLHLREDTPAREALRAFRAGHEADEDLDRLQIVLDLRTGHIAEAESTIHALAERTGETVNWSVYGDLARHLGDTVSARRGYGRALAADTADSAAHWGLAVMADAEGDSPGAILHMRSLIEGDPNHAGALNYIAYTWAREGTNLDEAEAYIRRALARDTDSPFYLDTLGWVLYKKGDLAGARIAIEAALLLMPEDPTVLDHHGDVLWALGEKEAALADWRRALAGGGGDDATRLPAKIAEGEAGR